MKIPVAGMDPSLRAWGFAEAILDLETGELSMPVLSLVETVGTKNKSQYKNSHDLSRAATLASTVRTIARRSKVIFVEVPVGSQSSRAMASYGICIGVLGMVMAEGIPLIQVTAEQVKLALTKNKNATKAQMIEMAVALYPKANFPNQRGTITAKTEHVADAIGAIHAGVRTEGFQNLMRLFKQVHT